MSSQIAAVVNDAARTVTHDRARRQYDARETHAGAEAVVVVAPEAARPAASAAPEAAAVETPELEAAVENIRDFVSDVRRELQFSVDEDSGRTIITVIDSDSGEIIRQIPPEEVMQIAKSVADGTVNLIDSRA